MNRRRRGSGPVARPDRAGLERAARLFLAAIGERSLKSDQRRTPRRVAAAWADEILSGYAAEPAQVSGSRLLRRSAREFESAHGAFSCCLIACSRCPSV